MVNHECTDEITCPWCGCEYQDSWEMGLDESYSPEDLEYCESCDKGFFPTRDVVVTYSTEKAKYGECVCCGKKDTVIVESPYSWRNIKDHCPKCYTKAEQEKRECEYKEYCERNAAQ